MTIISQLITILLALISLGTIMRIVICAFQLMGAEDEVPQIKKRIRNSVIFLILALSIIGLKDLIVNYYI